VGTGSGDHQVGAVRLSDRPDGSRLRSPSRSLPPARMRPDLAGRCRPSDRCPRGSEPPHCCRSRQFARDGRARYCMDVATRSAGAPKKPSEAIPPNYHAHCWTTVMDTELREGCRRGKKIGSVDRTQRRDGSRRADCSEDRNNCGCLPHICEHA
jgi:hypothetical protein